jgi:Mannosyl-glycoprotein endo-beta-N-acetylglucosaminidase
VLFLNRRIDPVLAANNGTGCNAKQAVSFIHTNQAAAATIAQRLNVPTQNILGLSGIESAWGQSNAALQANNFFGLHGGANAPFATGVWYTSGGVAMSSFPSYLASGQSFAAQFGSFVKGVSNRTAFAEALVKAGFNPATAAGGGNPNFVASLPARRPRPEHQKFAAGAVLARACGTAHNGRSECENAVPTCGAQFLPGIATPLARWSAPRRKPDTASALAQGSLRPRDPGLLN